MRICYLVPGALRRHPDGEREAVRRVAYLREHSLSGAAVELLDDPEGPPSVESEQEERIAATRVAQRAPGLRGHDAIIVGCFGDPGLREARAATAVPVIGPAQASCHLAAQLGRRFAILTVVEGVVPTLVRLVDSYGLTGSLAGVRAVDVHVVELRARRAETLAHLEREARAAMSDGAGALVLGCMTMGFLDIASELQDRVGVPVVNPVVASLHAAESAAAGGYWM